MRFPPSFLEEIRNRVPISDVVGKRVAWDRRKSQPSKGDYWACCPFHSEKSPSFHADDRKGRYHCFGCSVSGDIFTFLVEKEGLSFPEAVEQLAGLAGLQLPAMDPQAQEKEQARKSLFDVMELACAFFEARLQAREGAGARGYLGDRALEPATVKRFRIGYAPEGRHALKDYLADKGVSAREMVDTGLVIAGPDIPVSYDRFRDRIMFPITDLQGRIVGFGGRALSPDVPAKYLNSPETQLFHKGRLLYHAAEARRASRDAGTIIVVEGYMDVIALGQAGLEHCVAPLGTALTEDQLALLWRMCDEPILCFDGDQAGIKAAHRAVDTALPLLKPGKSLRFALLPEGQDPDDLVRAEGRDGIDRVLAMALPLVDMLWQREQEAGNWSTPERRAAFEARIGELTRVIGDESVRRLYAEEFRGRISDSWGGRPGRNANMSRGRGRGTGTGRRAAGAARAAPMPLQGRSQSLSRNPLARGEVQPIPPREAVLILTAINHLHVLDEQVEELGALELTNQNLDRLRGAILDIAAEEGVENAPIFAERLAARGFTELVGRLEALVRRERIAFALPDCDPQEARSGFRHTLALHRKSLTLHKELRAAEQAFAQDGSAESFARLVNIKTELESAEGMEVLLDSSNL